MSLIASRWAWEQQLESAAKLMLLALADHADDRGQCWPSVGRLVARTGSSPRTVQRKLVELVEAGLVTRSAAPGKLPVYVLHFPTPVTLAGVEGAASGNNPRHGDTPVTVTPPSPWHPTPVTLTGDPRQVGTPTPVNLTGDPSHSDAPTPVTMAPHPRQVDGGPPSGWRETPVTVTPEPKEEEEVRSKIPSLRSDHVRDPDKSGSTRSDTTAAAKPRRAPTQATEPAGFSEFWLAYPNKVAKPKALQAYARAVKRGAIPAEMLAGLRRFQFPEDVQFTPHPATWLNNDRWQDAAVRTPPSPQRQPGKSYAGCL